MLGHTYRFKVLNDTGQTIVANAVKVYGRRWKYGSDGSITFEGSEGTLLDNGSTIADNAYSAGTTQDNSSNKYIGGDFIFEVTAPASSNGDVTLYLEKSTDGGTDFDDDGLGMAVARLNFTTSGTKRRHFSL